MSPIDLAIFVSRVESVCIEMGAVLQRSAFSPNIKDRLDFSCALFDKQGELFAQAAHIPVHLGSMAFAMRDIVNRTREQDEVPAWQPGDMLVVNDPFLGGTHLPDVTIIAPFFVFDELMGFVVNRAHHANIGANTPGSMPLSTSLEEEGVVIPPTLFIKAGELQEAEFARITNLPGADTSGDFAAQISANRVGLDRLTSLAEKMGKVAFEEGITQVNDYGERIAQNTLSEFPTGTYHFVDYMDDNGFGESDIKIQVALTLSKGRIDVDFAGTAPQVKGNINCPLSVAAAGVFYAFRCLLPKQSPNCAGSFRAIHISAPRGCLLNAERPAATAAGNVETSMRVVDVVLGAFARAIPDQIPAASQGTMNNIAMGNHQVTVPWDYYETIAGGMGASQGRQGLTAVQSHMTNTLNTPIESLERHYPLRINRYAIRRGSGGEGQYHGGDGLVREFEFLQDAEVTLLGERRRRGPWGLAGGEAGQAGQATLDGKLLPAKVQLTVAAGQTLRIETPGGGGFGQKDY